VDELEAEGIRDNTMILYLCSDNGASGEGVNGTISELLAQNGMVTTVQQQINVLDRDYGGLDALGGPKVDKMYHHGWAWAGDTPLKYTKLIASHFGGSQISMNWVFTLIADQNIRGLDIPVDHSTVVRSLERIGNLGHDLQSSLQRHFLYSTLAFAP